MSQFIFTGSQAFLEHHLGAPWSGADSFIPLDISILVLKSFFQYVSSGLTLLRLDIHWGKEENAV